MSDECKGKSCSHYDACYSVAAKARLERSHVIVANYAVVFLNALLRKETGMDLVLPTHQVLVLDEAHKAADIARDFFGAKVRHTQVEWVTRPAQRAGGKSAAMAADLVKCSERFFRALQSHRKSKAYRIRLRRPGTLTSVGSEPLVTGLEKLAELYTDLARGQNDRDEAIALKNGAKNARVYAATILAADSLDDQERVFYVDEITDRDAVELCTKPIQIGPVLKQHVFNHVETAVVTSATLAVDGEFGYVSGELGVAPTHEIVAESPFDWQTHATFVGAEDMPEPNDATFNAAMCEAVVDVVRSAQGRTLCLFTSHARLKLAHQAVANAGFPFRVLRQGDMPRMKLVEEFKRDVTSVLMGTESFWAGVDVPGESLSCVVMDRLPFPTPDDPILDALGETDRNTFMSYSVPRAVIQFKQGAGRLLRAVDDRGVIVCLDRRIFSKGYGRKFLTSLPPMSYSREIEAVGEFLNGPVEEVGT
jgi:ATP-dependent DNA helicase DinG